MKIPKEIIICGNKWKVVRDGYNGGHFNCGKQTISIGKNLTEEISLEAFLHEVVEAIMCERSYRYDSERQQTANGDLIFLMSHKEMEHFVKDLKLALKGIEF